MPHLIDDGINFDLSTAAISKNQKLWVRVRGKSMFPALPDNSLMCILRCDAEDLRCGDIALFKDHGCLVAHRFFKQVRRNGSAIFKVKGDTTFAVDYAVKHDDIIAKVIAVKYPWFTVRIDNLLMRDLGLCMSQVMPYVYGIWGKT
jgi:signal peptidase I